MNRGAGARSDLDGVVGGKTNQERAASPRAALSSSTRSVLDSYLPEALAISVIFG